MKYLEVLNKFWSGIFAATLVSLVFLPNAWSKEVGDALQDMGAVSDTDPNGFKWMLVCIGLLFLVALSLITATTIYFVKAKKKTNQ